MELPGSFVDATIVNISGESHRFKFRRNSHLIDISTEVCEAFGKSGFFFVAKLIVDGCVFNYFADTPFEHACDDSVVTLVIEESSSGSSG